jgi:malate dehydrogenase
MTKRRDQPLKARPSGSSPRWTSGKILMQVLISSVLLALFVAVAIPALHLMTPSNKRSKDLGDLQIVSEPTPTPRLAPQSGSMPASPNAVYTGTVGIVVAKDSTESVHLAPVPTPTPAPQSAVNGNGVPTDRWFPMTRLDENKAKAQLAAKAGSTFPRSPIWRFGAIIIQRNIPIFYNAKIDGGQNIT